MRGCLWLVLGGVCGGRAEGVAECEEAVPGQAGVAGGGGRRAAGAELEEVVVVVVDEQGHGHEDDEDLEHEPLDEVHAEDQHDGDG